MTREDIENSLAYQAAKAGVEYTMQKHPVAIGGDNFADDIERMNRNETFEDGAEFGYKFAIKKACQWLETEWEDLGIKWLQGAQSAEIIGQFEEAMEL